MKTKNVLVAITVIASLYSATAMSGLSGYHVTPNTMSCAPEVISGNLSATDNVLSKLATDELSQAKMFKTLVANATALTAEDRMAAYLNLLSIQDDAELVAFISARGVNQKYVDSLKEKAGLDNDQAQLVIEKLSQSLLGKQK